MEINIKNSTADNDRIWQQVVMKYARPDIWKSVWQIVNTLAPYILLWYLMYRSLVYPYWVTLLLSLITVGFLVRLFIIFHDCGHRSYFKSKRANYIVGTIMGILAFTPFNKWHNQHRIHHETSGNLDKRGNGDVWTMSVEEYIKSSRGKRFLYRAFRNPFIMFTVGPVFVVFYQNRVTDKRLSGKERWNVYFTNAMVLAIAVSLSLLMGLKAFLMIQLPVILIAHSVGIWLFYIQHQFDDVIWERNNEWDYRASAITGSSFLKLPAVLQWFTGNIGFHNVHHLSSRIPNYNLARCHYENEMFRKIKPVVLFSTFRALNLSLWDEVNRKMISFRTLVPSRVLIE
jgi:acyl-lipid omega-6 desaturase (Delta-12 desaturase)